MTKLSVIFDNWICQSLHIFPRTSIEVVYIHSSWLTIAIVLVNLGMFYLNQIKGLGYKLVNWILILLLLETISGIVMYYADFPIGTQAVHLLSGALLFGVQFYLWLQSRKVQLVNEEM